MNSIKLGRLVIAAAVLAVVVVALVVALALWMF